MFLITGFLLGLSTLLFIGPVFFYLVKASIEGGKLAGISVAVGIMLGDFIYASIVYFGLGNFFISESSKWWMSLISGIILIMIGLKYSFFSANNNKDFTKPMPMNNWKHFFQGFIINFINPFVLAVWIYFVSYNKQFYNDIEVVYSLIVTLIVIFSIDFLKAIYSSKLNKILTPSRINKMFKLIGIVLLIFGFRFIYLTL